MPADNVQHVESWFVTGVAADGSSKRGPLRIWGVPRGTRVGYIQKRQRLWRSSSIVRRLSPTLLETRFGTRVRLSGPLDTQAATQAAMKPSAQNAFRDGFPYRWRAIASAAFDAVARRTRKTLPEQPIVPPLPPPTHTQESKKPAMAPKKKVPRMSAAAHIVVPVENFVPLKKSRPRGRAGSSACAAAAAAPSPSPPRARADSLPPTANCPVPPPQRRATIDAEMPPPPPTAAKPPRPRSGRRARRASQPVMPTANLKSSISPRLVDSENANSSSNSEPVQSTKNVEHAAEKDGTEASKSATRMEEQMKLDAIPSIEEKRMANDGGIVPPLQLQDLLEDEDIDTEEDEESPIAGEIPPLAFAARKVIVEHNASGEAKLPPSRPPTKNPSSTSNKPIKNPKSTAKVPSPSPCEDTVQSAGRTQPASNIVQQLWSVDLLLARRIKQIENGVQDQSKQKRESNSLLPNKRIMPRLVTKKVQPSNNRKQKQQQQPSKGKKTTQSRVATGKVEKKESPKKKEKRRISFRDRLDEEPPVPKRGGRRAARFAKAAIASVAADAVSKNVTPSSNTPNHDESGWSVQQLNAYEAQRDRVPLDSHNYWVLVAQGVPDKSAEECRARWLDTNRTPEKATKSKEGRIKKPSKGESTPDIAAAYAANGVTKAHARTARFASNMRRIVAASAREAAATAAPAFVPSPVAGYSPATPLRMDGVESDGTPGTEARVRRRQMEQFALPKTPEQNGNDKENGVQAADRVVAQFRKRFANLLIGAGTTAGTANANAANALPPLVETNRNVPQPTMEEALAARAQARAEAYDDDLLT